MSKLSISNKTKQYWQIFVICSLALFILLWQLGANSLEDWDEAIYAQISKEIVQGGDWWTLHWGYQPWFEKPPLYMWTTALFYQLFDISEFWSRAASAFSGIGLIFITYYLGKLVCDKFVGFTAAIILLSNYQFVYSARFGTTDIMLTLFTFLAVYAYFHLQQEDDQKWWYIVCTSCALAFMVKSAAGLIAPLAITLDLLLNRRLVASLQSRHFWCGLLLALVIISPWHISMYILYGEKFTDIYIGYHLVARSVSTLEGNAGDSNFYVKKLQEHSFPWFYLLPFALVYGVKKAQSSTYFRFLLLFSLLVFGIYTMAQTKIRWYIIPLCPAFSLLISFMMIRAIRSHKSIAFGGLTLATLVVAVMISFKVALILSLIGFLIAVFYLTSKVTFYKPLVLIMYIFFVIIGLYTIRPLYQGKMAPVASLSRIAARTSPNDQEALIVFSGLYEPTPMYYSNRPIEVAYTLEDLILLTEDGQIKRIILEREDIGHLSKNYDIDLVAEVDSLVYATIKLGDK